MSTLLALGLANSACAAVLAVPAYLVSRYARRPALAHALWLLVLLKLALPPAARLGLARRPAPAEDAPEAAAPPPPPPPPVPVEVALPTLPRDRVWVGPERPAPPPITAAPPPAAPALAVTVAAEQARAE